MIEGVRTLMLAAYEFPAKIYCHGFNGKRRASQSAARWLRELGIIIWYTHEVPSRRKRTVQDISLLIARWKRAILGLAVAHNKDEADRYEAGIEECLQPILIMPIKQLREFAVVLCAALKEDPMVPFLVWRSFEVWVDLLKLAPDEEVKELKTQLAQDIVELVEQDAKDQLPEAMIHALQWRSPNQLEEVKRVVSEEKREGRRVRLRGRESCLFLEAGGTEDKPKVCVQI